MRSFKAPRKTAGNAGAEGQANEFGEDQLWLPRLMRLNAHGVSAPRWQRIAAVSSAKVRLIADGRGPRGAFRARESPQLIPRIATKESTGGRDALGERSGAVHQFSPNAWYFGEGDDLATHQELAAQARREAGKKLP